MSLLAELRRRNVIRVAGLYLVGAWLLVQVAETVLPVFDVPAWVLRGVIIALALGFVPAVVAAWVFELTPEGLRREHNADGSPAPVDRTARRLDIVVIVLLLAVAGVTVMGRMGQGDAPAAAAVSGEPAATPAASVPSAGQSIAVLAFADLSPGKDQEYFSDGIAEEILNSLAKVPGLRVAGRTSAFHYKGRDEDLREIGSALGVAHVLEGSVRKQGERVRITAQLIRSDDGFHVWSETYDGEMSDVFALQERIARAITGELKVVLSGQQAKRLVNAGTANADAYAKYLQATAIFNRRESERYREAQALLEEAIALDPEFARAYARLASVLVVSSNVRLEDSQALLDAGIAAAQRAIANDSSLGEPHAAMGRALGQRWRHAEALAENEKAVALDPGDVNSQFWLAVGLFNTGYRRQGIAALDATLALDPMLPNPLFWRGREYVLAGDIDNGMRLLKLAAEGGHRFVGLEMGRVLAARGDSAGAEAATTAGLKYFSGALGPEAPALFAKAIHGDAAARQQSVALLEAYVATHPELMPGVVPYIFLRLGEYERGFTVAAIGPTDNDSLMMGDMLSPGAAPARALPAFQDYLRRSGLADVWQQRGPPDHCRRLANGDFQCD